MAIKINNHDDDSIVDINITPFVDVVLVLLVIFMVTAHLMVNRGMNVQLPKVSSSEQIKHQRNFNISISKDNKYMLDGQFVSMETLLKSAKNAKKNKEDIVVTLSADKGVVYDSVVHMMDELRLIGVSNFALQLDPLNK